MQAMQLQALGPIGIDGEPLVAADLPVPTPGPGELLIRVAACGVCHTELDEIEGRTPPPRLPVTPGHEVIGHVAAHGPGVNAPAIGTRVGIGWIHHGSGGPTENLDAHFRATGRDVDGGYAEYMLAHTGYAFPVPGYLDDASAAPLLCAGAVGWRALKLSGIGNGGQLGLTGFGGSAHIVLALVRHLYPATRVYVFARDPAQREFALSLGASWAGGTVDRAPEALDAIIDTTPAWLPVVEALANLRPGGRLVINAIRKEDGDKQALQELSYHEHLWLEREVKSVANVTGADIADFLPLAAAAGLAPTVQTYPLAEANRALRELRHGPVHGARVLVMTP